MAASSYTSCLQTKGLVSFMLTKQRAELRLKCPTRVLASKLVTCLELKGTNELASD